MIAILLMLLQLAPACPTQGWRTSPWGRRKDPITHRIRSHKGLDVGAVIGTEIVSMWPGKVARAGLLRGGYGNYVIIESGEFRVLYAHMDRVLVTRGEKIEKGQLVGTVGKSGRATGPHLHLSVTRAGRNVDPELYLGHCPDLP